MSRTTPEDVKVLTVSSIFPSQLQYKSSFNFICLIYFWFPSLEPFTWLLTCSPFPDSSLFRGPDDWRSLLDEQMRNVSNFGPLVTAASCSQHICLCHCGLWLKHDQRFLSDTSVADLSLFRPALLPH